MTRPVFFNNLTQAREACEKLGINHAGLSMAQMTAKVNKAKADKKWPHPPVGPTQPKPFHPFKKSEGSDVDSLKAAAKGARSATDKVAAYQALSDKLQADMHAAKAAGDMNQYNQLAHQWGDAQKRLGYAKMAYAAENPNAAKIRRYLDAADSN